MAITKTPAVLALLLGTSFAVTSAWAQDDAAATSPAEVAAEASAEVAPAENDAAPADAPVAEAEAGAEAATEAEPEASAEPEVGTYYAGSTHGDWMTRCIKAPNGPDPCELFQLLKDEQGNSVAEVGLIPLSGGQVAAGLTVTAPLETDLGVGLGFQIDSAEAKAYPFNVCYQAGCVSRIGLSGAEVSGLKRGKAAKVTVVPFGIDPANGVQLTMSLNGFTAGFDALAAYVEEMNAQIDKANAEAAAPAAE